MTRTAGRLALAAVVTAGFGIAAAPPAAAAPCVPRAAGSWCYEGDGELFCIEGSFDPFWLRLVECPY